MMHQRPIFRLLSSTIILIPLIVLGAFHFARGAAQTPIVLKLGHNSSTSDARHIAALRFKNIVEEKSHGRMQIDIYPAGEMGSWLEMQKGLELEALDIVIEGVGTLSARSNYCGLDALPFIFSSPDHFLRTWRGDLKNELMEMVRVETGFLHLGMMYRGGRNVTAIKPVKHLGDFKGLVIRTPPIKPAIDMWTLIGAEPVPMEFVKVYDALKHGVIHAQENPLNVIWNARIYEVAPNILLTNHLFGAFYFQFWDKRFKKIPKDLQGIIVHAADVASEEYTSSTSRREAEILENLKKKNTTINLLSADELEIWRAVLSPMYDEYPELLPYIERIKKSE